MSRRVAIPAAAAAIAVLVAGLLLAGGRRPEHGGPLGPAGLGGSAGSAQPAGPPASAGPDGPAAPGRPIVAAAGRHDTSKPLRSITPEPPEKGEADADAEEEHPLPGREHATPKAERDPVVQNSPVGTAAAASIAANFEGVSNINSVAPPDTNGDIGPNHYVQWVNLSFAIYDRSGTLLYGPAAGNTLWSGFGGPCESTNNGDPIAQYDHLANRWVLSQFALPNYPNGPFYECVAVSTTGDPTGSWYRYEFKTSDTKLTDYPHMGVWPDAYYFSFNQFSGNSWGGQGAAALERSRMLQGLSARIVYVDLFGVDPNLGGMLPSDLDGAVPPNGAPNTYVEADDNANGYPQDRLDLWKFHVDWTTPASSTFTHDVSLPTAAMDTNLCNYARNCIKQPPYAGNKTQGLDALSDRIMYRLQYRNFGSYQTLVTTQTVDVDGTDHAGIRWFEVRNTGSGWTIRQQGTWAPDANNRWLGSAAMNGDGAIGIGYSVASTSVYPSIRFAGRLAGDPLGTLGVAEGSIMAGSGTQTTSVARWGDYAMMAVDPTDDCTFWFTTEYVATTSNAPWRTRVAAAQVPGCGPGGDLTPPAVTSFAPTTPSPTNAATVSYALAFDETVTGLAAADFTRTGTATGCTVGAPSGSGASYTIGVSGCSDGTVILTLKASTVTDASSNVGPTTPSTASTVTIDRSSPTASLTSPASPTNATTLSFGVTFSQAVTGLAAGDFGVGGTATGCAVGSPSGSGASYTVALTGCSNGSVILTLHADTVTDIAANTGPSADVSASTVVVDRTGPTVTAPTASLRSGVQIAGSSLALHLSWTGSDGGGSGVATYDVARSTDGAAFTTIATGLTGLALNTTGTSGHTYRFEVRAHDVVGNVGGWLAGPTLKPTLVQQTSSAIGYHGTWTSSSYASYSGGSVKYATVAGAYASYTFTGRAVAFVTTRAASRGAAKVYLDGVLITTVDCYAASSTFRYVAFAYAWPSVGTHRITIKLVGTVSRPRVDLDAIEVVG
jgi:hypothetical protein